MHRSICVAVAVAALATAAALGDAAPAFPVLAAVASAAVAPLERLPLPLRARAGAALGAAAFDCVGVYAADEVAYTTWDGRSPLRAAPRARTEGRMATCAAAVIAATVDSLAGGAAAAAPVYAAAAAAGGGVPLRAANDSACDGVAASAVDGDDDAGCVGVAAFRRFAATHLDVDGMNADGRAGLPAGAAPRPYADVVTGYAPVNGPAAGVTDLTRWTPLTVPLPAVPAVFVTQTFFAPQMGSASPVLVPAAVVQAAARRLPPPYPSAGAYSVNFTCGDRRRGERRRRDPDRLCAAARRVLAGAAGVPPATAAAVRSRDLSLGAAAQLPAAPPAGGGALAATLTVDFIVKAALWDTTVAVWAAKVRHDAARPAVLLPAILPDADAWTSPRPTGAHTEYPSATAGVCALVSALHAALGGGARGGGGHGGGGHAPLPAAATCGDSTVWDGIHFPPAVARGRDVGDAIAAAALAVAACRAPGTPGLPPCAGGGGEGGRRRR